MSIKLSPKHGVNPCMPTCFWCGELTGEIALLGKLPNDIEAPKNTILDKEPCDTCKETFSKGFLLIETNEDRTFTGNFWLITKEAASSIFIAEISSQEQALITKEVATELGLYNAN